MADLYNLLDEIDQPQEQQQEEDLEDEQEWQGAGDREDVDLPPALQEAARKKLQGTPANADDYEDERVDLEDFNPEISLADLSYTHLQQLWTQEIHSPELLFYDDETIRGLTTAVEQQEEQIENMDLPEYNDEHASGNDKNMKALVQSVLKIDADRVKFLLSDVLRRRLTKIEEHPLHMRTLTDRMSDGEVRDVIQENDK